MASAAAGRDSAILVRKHFVADTEQIRSALWEDKNDRLAVLAEEFNGVVRRALVDTRASLGLPVVVPIETAQMPPLPAIDVSTPGAFVGLLGFLIHPAVGVITTLIGLTIGTDVAGAKR